MSVRGWTAVKIALVATVLALGAVQVVSAAGTQGSTGSDALAGKWDLVNGIRDSKTTPEEREAAAARRELLEKMVAVGQTGGLNASVAMTSAVPGGIPDYFGSTPNWAYTAPIRKFVDTLPGTTTGAANNLGQYIPTAVPDTVTYPGSDYYEIELRQYTEKMHSDLAPTTLRGYVQVNNGTDSLGNNTIVPATIHYLGPTIVASKDRPVRIKFTNKLPTGAGGDLFIPVDTTMMGAGMGPLGMNVPAGQPMDYTENRATLHLHGGRTVWISDGTPHQWITPAGENTPYPEGVSVQDVPDMPDPGPGSMTFIYSNQQSARMMFYHDHSYGITRLNVYAGEAAAYFITEPVEQALVASGTIPAEQIPLVIQDKTFVDTSTVRVTDPTWNWGTGSVDASTGIRALNAGDLWFPHVYLPNQNPYDIGGANAIGRWDYAPWFWPPMTNLTYGPIANPYYDPVNAPWEPPVMPATPNPSSVMEAFMDTPVVNGTAYPSLTVQPKTYRFRILNAANDRFWNLQIYQADTSTVAADGRTLTEVRMATATPTPGWPADWPTDGRDGGVPDPTTVGPAIIQIGTEGGFLPAPAVVAQQPVDWNRNMRDFTFGNVIKHSLLLGPAERADVIVDFSAYAGKTLILYNDAPAAFPARDPRVDYYTGDPDQTAEGGTTSTPIGYGPNTRTVMQIKVAATAPAPAFDLAKLQASFATTGTTPGVFAASQPPVIMPTSSYDSAYNKLFPADQFVRIQDTVDKTFTTIEGTSLTIPLQPKAIHDEMNASFDPVYGRMQGNMGLELPGTTNFTQNMVLYGFADPPTENLTDCTVVGSPVAGDGTQIWKITHNGVDTHAMHFHLMDVQLINRVGWDGAIRQPDANELGWKDTVRVSPLEDTIVALRPVSPKQVFGVPDSIRPYNPTMPIGSTDGFSNLDPLTGQPMNPPVSNVLHDFGWEYVWHCHILGHEEMDMMRPMTLAVDHSLPATPSLAATGLPGAPILLKWLDPTPPTDPATLGNPKNEIGFKVMRATVNPGGVVGAYSQIATALANATAFTDSTTTSPTAYAYQVFSYNATGQTGSNVVRVSTPGYFATNIIGTGATGGGRITRVAAALVAGFSAQADIQLGSEEVTSGLDSSEFLIEPDPHHHIVDVLVDGVSVGPVASYQFTNVLTDHTLMAVFAIDTFTVTATAGTGGSISPSGPQIVAYGSDSPAFVIGPAEGYHTTDVQVDGVPQGPIATYTFTNVTATHTIDASFALNEYALTTSAGAHGSITPAGPEMVPYGSNSPTFQITPDAGYRIGSVTVDGIPIGRPKTYQFVGVTSTHDLGATFVPDVWVYRFYNRLTGTHLYTADTAERDRIQATLGSTFNYDGPAMRAYVGPDGVDVFRFYIPSRGMHFYTASVSERDDIMRRFSDRFVYEGPVFQMAPSATDASPVFRFYNRNTGGHFYTASITEKDHVVQDLASIYSYEGEAFFTPN